MIRTFAFTGLVLIVVGVCGCGNQSTQVTSANAALLNIDASEYILADEPEGAIGILEAREDAKDQDEIVLMGRIGGRENPWIEGRAAFTMIDAAMTVVSAGTDAGESEICLDDCCASERAACTTLVKVVDEDGKPLAIDARQLLGVKANDMIVVNGTVQRSTEDDSFSIAASGVYVRR